MLYISVILLMLSDRISGGGPPKFESQPSNLKVYPQELMVDLTNRFAFKILYLHSISNKNNIAFSPCGLASVLIALFEGSEGKSAIEIHQSLDLPWERDIVRVGFRDIHRRLRTYFYKNENILSGLSLSRDNITIRPEYETVLRFYGYEVEGIIAKDDDNESENTTDQSTTKSEDRESTDMMTTQDIQINTTMMTMTKLETTTMKSSTSPMTTTNRTTTEVPTTTESPTTSEITKTTEPTTTTESPPITTTNQIYTFKSIRNNETVTPLTRIPVITRMSPPRIRPSRGSRTYFRTKRDPTIIRIRRSPIDYEISPGYDRFTPNFFYPITPYPAYQISPYDGYEHEYESKFPQSSSPAQHSQYQIHNKPNHHQSKDPEEETINHFFYLNQLETIQVPFKYYNTVLKYAYIDSIRASVLELDLDSDNYNMLIILPDYESGLDNLMNTMKMPFSMSIRDIKKQLEPEWVKAIVPKINLRGNIMLTNDLQNVSIILDFFL